MLLSPSPHPPRHPQDIKAAISPTDTLLVVDAMTGQEAATLAFARMSNSSAVKPASATGVAVRKHRPPDSPMKAADAARRWPG